MKQQTVKMFKEIMGAITLTICFLGMAVATLVVFSSCGGDKSTGPVTGSMYQYYHPGSGIPFYRIKDQPMNRGTDRLDGHGELPITVSSSFNPSGYYTEEEFKELGIEIVGGGGRNLWGNCPPGTYIGLHCERNGIGMWLCFWSADCESFADND